MTRLVRYLCAVLAAAVLVGCRPAAVPWRATLSEVTLTLGRALVAADRTCASIALSLPPEEGLPLAEACGDSYDAARVALLAAGDAIDAGAEADAGCALSKAATAVSRVVAYVRAEGHDAPDGVARALAMAAGLTCPAADAGH